MPTKIAVIINNPDEPEAFEAAYHPGHLQLVAARPGVERVEAAKVWPKEDGSTTPAYRLLDIYFPDYDTASNAVETVAAAVWLADLQRLATGGTTAVFANVEQGRKPLEHRST